MSRQSELAALGRVADTGALSNRRLTYNGAMNVWQRGTSDDTATSGDYMCDRWYVVHTGLDGNVDWDQETSSTPDGFAYALKVSTDASETSLDAGDYLMIGQKFEGQDLQHLLKGSANAKKVTVSFWVRSSVASTYTLELRDNDNNRNNHRSYTIDVADTWEYKTITFDGDTSSADPFNNDANTSMTLGFWVDAGSTYTGGTFSTAWQDNANDERVYDTTGWLESTSPTFYITGVQLEVGDTATEFEHRSYGDELQRCQRYYYKIDLSPTAAILPTCTVWDTQNAYGDMSFPTVMRSTPTFQYPGGSNFTFYSGGISYNPNYISSNGSTAHHWGVHYRNSGTNFTAGNAIYARQINSSAYVSFDAEL